MRREVQVGLDLAETPRKMALVDGSAKNRLLLRGSGELRISFHLLYKLLLVALTCVYDYDGVEFGSIVCIIFELNTRCNSSQCGVLYFDDMASSAEWYVGYCPVILYLLIICLCAFAFFA